jgi:hypothetical protein
MVTFIRTYESGPWIIDEYDNKTYRILLRRDLRTGKVIRFFFTPKIPYYDIEIKTIKDDFYISITGNVSYDINDIDKLKDRIDYAKNLITYIKENICNKYSF